MLLIFVKNLNIMKKKCSSKIKTFSLMLLKYLKIMKNLLFLPSLLSHNVTQIMMDCKIGTQIMMDCKICRNEFFYVNINVFVEIKIC